MQEQFKKWKNECEFTYAAFKDNKWIEIIFNYLSEFDLTLGTNAAFYHYNGKHDKVDTRRLVYYKGIGLFKLIIICDTTHDTCYTQVELIRRTENNMKKIQDIGYLLDSDWRLLLNYSPYKIFQFNGFEDFKENFQLLIGCVKRYLEIENFISCKEDLQLKAMEIEHFKSIKNAKIEFNYPLQVLVGANNAGKTSLIQGILFAYRALYRLINEKKIKFNKNGFMMADKENVEGTRMENVPFIIDNFKELFNINTFPSEHSKGVKFAKFEFQNEIFIELDMRIVGEYFSVRLRSCSNGISKEKINKFLKKSVTLIPTFFTVTLNEERKYKGRYNSLMKSGNYNMLFRNILLDLKNSDKNSHEEDLEISNKNKTEEKKESTIKENKYDILKDNLDRIFGVKNLRVNFIEDLDEYISVKYETVDSNNKGYSLDISSLGMGTLQFIQVVAQTLIGEPFLILLDEPDAHLNAKLQKDVILFFNELAEKYNVTLLIATHSKDIINCVSPSQVLSLKDGNLGRINQTDEIIELFRTIGATTEELVGIGIGKRIILVEGDDDVKYIKRLCENVGINKSKYYEMINFIDFDGRTGVLTNRLEKYIPSEWESVQKLAIFDRDYRFPQDQKSEAKKLIKKGFKVVEWQKKEFENYLLVDSLLIRVLKKKYNADIDSKIIEDVILKYYSKMKYNITIEFEKELQRKKMQKMKEETGLNFEDIEMVKKDEAEVRKEAEEYIKNSSKRDILCGKDILDEIRINAIKRNTPNRENFILSLIDEIMTNELHEDIKKLLKCIKDIASD